MSKRSQITSIATGEFSWETMKATRRNVGHSRAMQESSAITKSQWQLMGKKTPANIDVNDIISALSERKVPFVLTGAHAIGGWTGRPRATKDIDILVSAGRNHGRAVKVLGELYPHLVTRRLPGVTAFFVPGENESLIDVIYPHRADLSETLFSAVWVKDGSKRYRIPSLEAALTNKYAAMLTPNRDAGKRMQDAADFTFMVKHSLDPGRTEIDLAKIEAFGNKVWPGGGQEILRLVDEVRAGGIVDLKALIQRMRS